MTAILLITLGISGIGCAPQRELLEGPAREHALVELFGGEERRGWGRLAQSREGGGGLYSRLEEED